MTTTYTHKVISSPNDANIASSITTPNKRSLDLALLDRITPTDATPDALDYYISGPKSPITSASLADSKQTATPSSTSINVNVIRNPNASSTLQTAPIGSSPKNGVETANKPPTDRYGNVLSLNKKGEEIAKPFGGQRVGPDGRPPVREIFRKPIAKATAIMGRNLPAVAEALVQSAIGLWIEDTDNEGNVRIYQQKPDVKAAAIIFDRVMGKQFNESATANVNVNNVNNVEAPQIHLYLPENDRGAGSYEEPITLSESADGTFTSPSAVNGHTSHLAPHLDRGLLPESAAHRKFELPETEV